MKRSTERILTTHTGSLPRPPQLIKLLYAHERDEAVDPATFNQVVKDAVHGIVRQQLDVGVDVINDGEQAKVSYASYPKDRLAGYDSPLYNAPRTGATDLAEFPEYAKTVFVRRPGEEMKRKACVGPVSYRNVDALKTDLENFRAALNGVSPADTFMSSASPGVIAFFLDDQYYNDHEKYVWALADAMKPEYDAIHQAGFILQLDCPDFGMCRHAQFGDKSTEEFRKIAEMHVEALNHATKDIPEDRMRMHICWGNYEGPHHRDVAFRDIAGVILKARPQGISFEASNPRHAHEWKIWRDVKLPEGKVLIPGVLDSTTNFIEHPELVAQRIANFASVAGRENVIAGTDCGFSTGAGYSAVDPQIAWEKFRSMAEGARIASAELWK